MHRVDGTTADISVDMGKANTLGPGDAVLGGRRFSGVAIDVGNPHLACVDPDLTVDALAALDVAAPVSFDPAQFPDGVNVEILTAPDAGAVHMRVHERGSAKHARVAPERSRPRSPRWPAPGRTPAR